MSHAIQNVAFAFKNQDIVSTKTFKEIKPIKILKGFIKSTVRVASLLQYFGKSEISFNSTVNNHREDLKNANKILACKHFNKRDHDFNNHGKFIIILQQRNISTHNINHDIKRKNRMSRKLLDQPYIYNLHM